MPVQDTAGSPDLCSSLSIVSSALWYSIHRNHAVKWWAMFSEDTDYRQMLVAAVWLRAKLHRGHIVALEAQSTGCAHRAASGWLTA